MLSALLIPRRSCRYAIHLSITGRHHDDGSVHTSSTSNHVLDVIGVTGAIDVSIMSVFGLVFDMGGGNGDTTLALFRGLINGAIVEKVGETFLCLSFRDSGGQRGL
jgi:hypothetical protein